MSVVASTSRSGGAIAVLSVFSSRTRAEILSSFPEWAPLVEEVPDEGGASLLVTVAPRGVAAAERLLRISTHDDEITVEFDFVHAHFASWLDSSEALGASALHFVQLILSEQVVAVSWWLNGRCWAAGTRAPSAQPPKQSWCGTTRVRSWSGTYNFN